MNGCSIVCNAVLKTDIFGITETWANENVLDSELQLDGYQMFRCDHSTGNKGGGVALYVKNRWNPTEFHTKSKYDEHVWCQVGDLVIGVCYRSTNATVVGCDNGLQELSYRKQIARQLHKH